MDMASIVSCSVTTCAYNRQNSCHTPGITVGDHAECNTYNHGSRQGGYLETRGAVGACLASDCRFNEQLECRAPGINVSGHTEHADCITFDPKVIAT